MKKQCDGADQDVRKQIVVLMDRLQNVIRPILPGEIEESGILGLTLAQFRILSLVHDGGPLRMSSISQELGVGLSAITSVVHKLEKKGLVAREHCTDDRRLVLCSATVRGKEAIENYWAMRHDKIIKILDQLSDKDVKLIDQTIRRLLQVVENNDNLNSDGVLVTAKDK